MAKSAANNQFTSTLTCLISTAILLIWPIACLVIGANIWEKTNYQSLMLALQTDDEQLLNTRLLNLGNSPQIITIARDLKSFLIGYEDKNFERQTNSLRTITYGLGINNRVEIQELKEQFDVFTIGLPAQLASNELVDKIRDYCNKLINTYQSIEAKERLISAVKNNNSSLAERYRLIAQDSRELFGLTSKIPDWVSEDNFYKTGILAKTPILVALKDDIQDSAALRSELQRIGGAVKFKGENAATEFQDALNRIREASIVLLSDISNEDLQNKKLRDEVKDLQQLSIKEQKLVRLSLQQLLAEVIRSGSSSFE